LKRKYLYSFILIFLISVGAPAFGEELDILEVSDDDSDNMSLSEFIPEIDKYRDPFIPLIGGETHDEVSIKGQIKLEGILWNPKNPLVVLNGEILKEGDKILGAIVKTINKDKVLLEYNNQTFSLVFWEK